MAKVCKKIMLLSCCLQFSFGWGVRETPYGYHNPAIVPGKGHPNISHASFGQAPKMDHDVEPPWKRSRRDVKSVKQAFPL